VQLHTQDWPWPSAQVRTPTAEQRSGSGTSSQHASSPTHNLVPFDRYMIRDQQCQLHLQPRATAQGLAQQKYNLLVLLGASLHSIAVVCLHCQVCAAWVCG
jgi:hypothetical protein